MLGHTLRAAVVAAGANRADDHLRLDAAHEVSPVLG